MKQKCATVIALNKWDITQTDLEDAKAKVARKLRQRPQVMAVAARSRRGMKRLVAGAVAGRPVGAVDSAPGEPLPRRPPGAARAAGSARQADAHVLHGPVRDEPAALRDPGEQPRPLTRDYAYFLENRLRDRYGLQGVPLVIDFKTSRGRSRD